MGGHFLVDQMDGDIFKGCENQLYVLSFWNIDLALNLLAHKLYMQLPTGNVHWDVL